MLNWYSIDDYSQQWRWSQQTLKMISVKSEDDYSQLKSILKIITVSSEDDLVNIEDDSCQWWRWLWLLPIVMLSSVNREDDFNK